MFILDVFDEQKTKEEVKEILQRHEGVFIKEEELGIKKLAYLIKKRENGYYYLVEIELPSSSLKEINADIRLNEKILKYMVVLQNEKKKLSKAEKKKAAKKAEASQPSASEPTSEKVDSKPSESKTEAVSQESSAEK